MRSVLEIGTWSGWSSLILAAYLSRFTPDTFRLDTFDIQDFRLPCVKMMHGRVGVHFHNADIHSIEIGDYFLQFSNLPSQFDLCIIDGVHTDSAARAELFRLKGRCKHTVLHDVISTQYVGFDYRYMWLQLKAVRPHLCEECIMQAPGTRSTFGFGILHSGADHQFGISTTN